MDKFQGSFDELKELVTSTGVNGKWEDKGNCKQFRSKDGAVLNWYMSTSKVQYQGSEVHKKQFSELLAAQGKHGKAGAQAGSQTHLPTSKENKKVFVVHGHDDVAREQLELVLHKLGLDPFVLASTGGGGLTIIEALEREFGSGPNAARFGIVLLTPDDVGYSKKDGVNKAEPRARQNVVLEMGMLLSAIKRPNVVILKKGHIEVPSDASGVIYIPFNDHIKEAVPRLVDRLRSAGFNVDPSAITKASS
jgi:predicted nucleotide-binding protein